MSLTNKEKIIALISNGITLYSITQEKDDMSKNTNLYDFILKIIPKDLKSEISVELIDEIFHYVSVTHSS
jgi:hypothetical protein